LETDAVTAAAASEASGSPYEAGIVADPALAALATTASLSTDTLTVMSTAELERTVEIEVFCVFSALPDLAICSTSSERSNRRRSSD